MSQSKIVTLTPARVTAAAAAFRKCPMLGPIVRVRPKPTFEPARDVFGSLAGAIISQQLSTKAASTIHNRFLKLIHKRRPDAKAVLKCSR